MNERDGPNRDPASQLILTLCLSLDSSHTHAHTRTRTRTRTRTGIFSNSSPLRPNVFISRVGVPLIFLLSSLGLPQSSLLSALHSPLLVPVQLTSLLLVPLLNLALYPLYSCVLPPSLSLGVLLLSGLPTTVNMCVSLSTACSAHVPTAVLGAVVGNLLGIAVTPAWWSVMTRGEKNEKVCACYERSETDHLRLRSATLKHRAPVCTSGEDNARLRTCNGCCGVFGARRRCARLPKAHRRFAPCTVRSLRLFRSLHRSLLAPLSLAFTQPLLTPTNTQPPMRLASLVALQLAAGQPLPGEA